MQESDMLKARDAFSNRAATIYAQLNSSADVQYTSADIIAIYDSFEMGFSPESEVFEQTLKMNQKETIKNDYLYLNGYYHMYHYWKSGDRNDSGKIRRNLIQVYDLDSQQGLMKCRLKISPMKHRKKMTGGCMKAGWSIFTTSFSGYSNVSRECRRKSSAFMYSSHRSGRIPIAFICMELYRPLLWKVCPVPVIFC